MPLEPGLIAYAGLATIAAARKKHRRTGNVTTALSPAIAKGIGALLLATSIFVAFRSFGPFQGVVAWTGQLCVAAVVLVLIMSWNSNASLRFGIVTILVAFGFSLSTAGGGQ
jgi:hypothetical protein